MRSLFAAAACPSVVDTERIACLLCWVVLRCVRDGGDSAYRVGSVGTGREVAHCAIACYPCHFDRSLSCVFVCVLRGVGQFNWDVFLIAIGIFPK